MLSCNIHTAPLSFYLGSGLVAKLYLTLATPWTVACQVPLCMEFSRQKYWSGLPFPSVLKQILTFAFAF